MHKNLISIILLLTSISIFVVATVLTINRSTQVDCSVNRDNLNCFFIDSYEGFLNLFRKDKKLIKQVTLTYSSLNMPSEVMQPLVDEYQGINPLVKIRFEERFYDDKDIDDYKSFIKTSLIENRGPTIYTIHSTWVNELLSEISNQNSSITAEMARERFFPVVGRQTINKESKVLAIPLSYDGLGFFYNKDLLLSENFVPPTTWDELGEQAVKLTVLSSERGARARILRAGAAVGELDNVMYSTDIIGLLFAQSNIKFPDDLNKNETAVLISKYLDFSLKQKVWDKTFPLSINAFAANQVAYAFLKNKDIYTLKKLNPTLNYGIAALPQFPKFEGGRTNVTWASYYVETVSNDVGIDEQRAAWDFLVWLTEDLQQKKLRNGYIKYYDSPYIYSNISLNQSDDTLLNKSIRDGAQFSVGGILCDLCGNDKYVNLFKEGVKQVAMGSSSNITTVVRKLTEAQSKIQAELRKK